MQDATDAEQICRFLMRPRADGLSDGVLGWALNLKPLKDESVTRTRMQFAAESILHSSSVLRD